MLKKIMLASVLALTLSSCGYQGSFRYPCQDPANWENAECKPPICTSSGTCPADVVKSQAKGTTNG